jgi:Asp-tRNA(Asn)/Glu-tRNA(Gln) amidotransferase A subunit family amidase
MSPLADGEFETAAEMAAALGAGLATSEDLVRRAVERAEAWQPVTNALSQDWFEEALETARRIDGSGRAEDRPLAGIPVAVKDLFDVTGHETTGCCAAYAGRMAERDAPTGARARRAGLVMIGKTNQHELAAGGTNLVSACGATHNPWDPSRMTGGSSGGSAAAVATGTVPWALGSDTGGSIRIPASLCGTVGLKPTTGLVTVEGMLPLAPSLDTPGPLAATVEDAWLLHCVMAQVPLRSPVRDWLLRRPERPFRVGVPDGIFAESVHEETALAVLLASEALSSAGAIVEPIDGRGIEDARKVWAEVCYPEFAAAHPLLRDPAARSQVAPSVAAWMDEGEAMPEGARAAAAARRVEIARWFRERLWSMDALLIPTTPYPAPLADQREVDLGPPGVVRVSEVGPGFLTCSVNLAGLPAISLPAGWARDGLPIGVSLVGGEGDEETIARVAMRWEALVGFRPHRPPLPG